MRGWERVWKWWMEGYRVPEIARNLKMDRSDVFRLLRTAQINHERGQEGKTLRERRAEAMASVYPDRARQDWIYRQMGVERREEG